MGDLVLFQRLSRLVVASKRATRPPRPSGDDGFDHSPLGAILDTLRREGIGALPDIEAELAAYLGEAAAADPDGLSPLEALAYWINLYNGAALLVAARAQEMGAPSILRVPGAFDSPVAAVAGEELSLNDIEHGKVRRFRDPRVHAALVCGSVSCPTLRPQPFGGEVDAQLDEQMRSFLAGGGAIREGDAVVLSAIFSWFSGDFTRPHRMPTLLPSRRSAVLAALTHWFEADTAAWVARTRPQVRYAPYDWRLGCAVG